MDDERRKYLLSYFSQLEGKLERLEEWDELASNQIQKAIQQFPCVTDAEIHGWIMTLQALDLESAKKTLMDWLEGRGVIVIKGGGG